MSPPSTNLPTYPDLAGKVVWVTGSSRGIGAEIARRFAEQRAKVAVHGRDAAALSTRRGGAPRWTPTSPPPFSPSRASCPG